MTPKEQAESLVKKHKSKANALIDVNSTLWVLSNLRATTEILKQYRFWFEVKIELEKL